MEDLVKRLRAAAIMSEALSIFLPHSEGSAVAKLYNEAAEAIEELSKPQWIPTTERLPELNVACLVYNKYYGPMVGWRIDGERFRIPGSRFPDHPTHWMPLPKGPKEE